MYTIDETLSKRLTSVRFPLIVLVVFIHNSVSEVRFSSGTEFYFIPEYVRIVRTLITEIVARSAVPLFFLISGFLLYAKNQEYLLNLLKKSRSIFLPYVLWTLISVAFFYLAQGFSLTKEYFANPQNIIRNFTLIDWVDIFAGKFTERNPYPFVYQFWFLRDLLILNVFSFLIKKTIDAIPLFYFVATLFFWINNTDLRIVNSEALLFFSFGYYVVKYRLSVDLVDSVKLRDLMLAYSSFVVFELAFPVGSTFIHKINVFLGLVIFLRLSLFLICSDRLYFKLAWLGGYSFFVYAFHEPLLTILKKLSVKVIPMYGGFILVQYFLVVVFGVLVSLAVGFIINKMTPRIYALLTGERQRAPLLKGQLLP